MSDTFLLNLSALIAVLPLAVTSTRAPAGKTAKFWLLMVVAIVGPGLLLIIGSQDGWHTDLSTALWITVTASLVLFAAISAVTGEMWRLGALFAPYMFLLASGAVVWTYLSSAQSTAHPEIISGWVTMHIVVSVATYALVTLAAVAGLAAALQARALKAKTQTPWIRHLPSLADCDHLVMRLLITGEAVLAIGMISGMALQYSETQTVIALNHKSILALAAFVVIGCLLAAHFKSGLRGRKAARVVLFVYLLLTLSYPGVKIVTDVILAE